MRIAMLTEGWKPIIGGGQIYTEYLCDYLIKKYDCKIDLFTRRISQNGIKYNNDEKINNNFNIYRIGFTSDFFNLFSRFFALLSMTFVLYKKAKIEKYDLICAQAILPGLPAVIVGKLLNIRTTYTIHGSMYLDVGKKGLFYYIEKFFFTKLKYDLLISVSHNILKHKNINKNIKVIYPGVNFSKFQLKDNINKYEGLSLLFVGRLDWQKGLEYLIEGASLLDSKDISKSGLKINIVGGGNLKDSLQKLICAKGLENIFEFKGKLSDKDLSIEYQKNHIFILPSLAEGQPVVVFEAFSNKMPVIATDVGDNKYFIKDNENGFLIKSGDAEEIKNILEKVMKISKTDLERMGINGYNLVIKSLTWDKIVDQIYNEYLKLLNHN